MPENSNKKLNWVNALKAFALTGIIINHFAEEFQWESWFTNPSIDWPDFTTRMHQLLPIDHSIFHNMVRYLGWLGDSCPGVFIVLSGFTLMLSAHKVGLDNFNIYKFYKKRLLRIFPLYISIHLITLLAILITSGYQFEMASKNNILSLLGLRFSDYLFFYINPSWWYIWLIIQLYVVFPFLLKMLQKAGIKTFLIITLAFTIISRLIGILNLQSDITMFNWMTGAFFGSRLAEFAMGMAGAYLFSYTKDSLVVYSSTKKIVPIAVVTYILGVFSSFTLFGSLLSNLLVSLGLCGIFYGLWLGIENLKIQWIQRFVLWIGINSYAIFLLHQFPLQQTAGFSSETVHTIMALLSIAVSIPLAFGIDVLTNNVLDYFNNLSNKHSTYIALLLCFTFYLFIIFIEPDLGNSAKYNLLTYLELILLIFLSLLFSRISSKPLWLSLISTTIILGVVYFIFMPKTLGGLVLGLFAGIFPVSFMIHYVDKKKWRALALSMLAISFVSIPTELLLKRYRPLETLQQCEEQQALQIHGKDRLQITIHKQSNYRRFLANSQIIAHLLHTEEVIREKGN